MSDGRAAVVVLRQLTGLPVVGATRHKVPDLCTLWALALEDGRLVVLGDTPRMRDKRHLRRVVTAAGGDGNRVEPSKVWKAVRTAAWHRANGQIRTRR